MQWTDRISKLLSQLFFLAWLIESRYVNHFDVGPR
jgi:hypothetical protein